MSKGLRPITPMPVLKVSVGGSSWAHTPAIFAGFPNRYVHSSGPVLVCLADWGSYRTLTVSNPRRTAPIEKEQVLFQSGSWRVLTAINGGGKSGKLYRCTRHVSSVPTRDRPITRDKGRSPSLALPAARPRLRKNDLTLHQVRTSCQPRFAASRGPPGSAGQRPQRPSGFTKSGTG